MKQDEVHNKLVAQSDAIDQIADQLRWILKEANTRQPKPGSRAGNELTERFYQLYRDFRKIQEKTVQLAEEVDKVKFTDKALSLVYRSCAKLLIRRTMEGIFNQFTSVAETGDLPKKK